jgi:hypothetical protein
MNWIMRLLVSALLLGFSATMAQAGCLDERDFWGCRARELREEERESRERWRESQREQERLNEQDRRERLERQRHNDLMWQLENLRRSR